MRYIDADELMEHVGRDRLDSRELIAEMINNAPTERVVPIEVLLELTEELEDMVCDVNIREIISHDTDVSLRQWILAWGNETKRLIKKIKKYANEGK